MHDSVRSTRLAPWTMMALSVVWGGTGGVVGCAPGGAASGPRQIAAAVKPVVASPEEVGRFCGACHAYPPPETITKSRWPFEVRRGFDFYAKSGLDLNPPPVGGVIAHYVERAPEDFPVLPATESSARMPFDSRRREIEGPWSPRPSAISHVGLASLSSPDRPDVLACDMSRGELLVLRAGDPRGRMVSLAKGLAHPAHAEIADLDRDGIKDILIADLGVPMPSDDRSGRVLWLRGSADGSYETNVLASGLGRVCDVQPADFDGDGDLDLVVAVFGWRRAGEILYLEQRPGPRGRPEFVRRILDPRHGAIHVPVADLDGDGRPDFVALISQEHEAVVAFLNTGDGRFKARTLYAAPHPAYGSSGIQLTDLDADGDLDVLLSNGDVYDSPLLKPYHGVVWLENRGDGPFEPHPLGAVYGAHRALAGDIDGDGDLDVVATSFLGEPLYGAIRREVKADAVVLFEQVGPGRFARHVLERESCDYPTFALGDLDADGDLDLVAGSFRDFGFTGRSMTVISGPGTGPLAIWENLRSADDMTEAHPGDH